MKLKNLSFIQSFNFNLIFGNQETVTMIWYSLTEDHRITKTIRFPKQKGGGHY